MKRGDKVEQVMPAPFRGLVTHFSIDQETGEKLVHVQNDEGVGQFFRAEDLKVEPAAAEEEPAAGE